MKLRWCGTLCVPVIVVAETLSACGGGNAETSSESAATTANAIVNGTALSDAGVATAGLVAVFHADASVVPGGWWPRPCSGFIASSSGGLTRIVTARHCVTVDGSNTGVPLPASGVAVSAVANAGLAGSGPPAGTIFASIVDAHPPATDQTEVSSWDLAIVTVPVDWSSHVTARRGFYVGDPAALVNQTPLIAYGYGLSTTENCSDLATAVTGAGVARYAFPFTVSTGSWLNAGGIYSYVNKTPGTPYKAVTCGDSGGPDALTFSDGSQSWVHYVGVHSRGAPGQTAISTAFNFWSQGHMGGLFVSPFSAQSSNIANVNGTATLLSAGDSEAARLLYTHAYLNVEGVHRIVNLVTLKCLEQTSSGVVFNTCVTGTNTSQQMTPGGDLRIKNAAGQCLAAAANGGLSFGTCAASGAAANPQTWAFHPQR